MSSTRSTATKSPSFNDYRKRVRSEYIRIKQQRRLKNTLDGRAFFASNRQMLNEGLQELRNLQKKVYVKPFPDPAVGAGGGCGGTPTTAASTWSVTDAAMGGDGGATFTPTIRKGTAQLFKVMPDFQLVETPPPPQQQQHPSNSGKKVNLLTSGFTKR